MSLDFLTAGFALEARVAVIIASCLVASATHGVLTSNVIVISFGTENQFGCIPNLVGSTASPATNEPRLAERVASGSVEIK